MNEFLTFAMLGGTQAAEGAAGAEGGVGSSMPMILMMVGLFAAMYFFTIRPQKKQQKMEQQIRENTQIGDEITTIGGICGKVVSVKDDSVVIETGSDRVKIKFKILLNSCIQSVNIFIIKLFKCTIIKRFTDSNH